MKTTLFSPSRFLARRVAVGFCCFNFVALAWVGVAGAQDDFGFETAPSTAPESGPRPNLAPDDVDTTPFLPDPNVSNPNVPDFSLAERAPSLPPPPMLPFGQNPAIQAVGESATWEGFLSGRLVPLNVKFSEMKSGWSSLRVQENDAKPATDNSLKYRADPFFRDISERFGGDGALAFAQGRTVRLNGDTFLVIYRPKFPSQQEIDRFFQTRFPNKQTMPTPQQATTIVREWLNAVPLHASLLNTRNVKTVEDVAAFNFETQFAPVATGIEADLKRAQQNRLPQITSVTPANRATPPKTSRTVTMNSPATANAGANGASLPPKR